MKKVILLVLFLVIFLNGCYYQPELRPKPNSPEIWICEEPYAELYWTDDGDSGKIVACGKVYDVAFYTTAGPQMMVYAKEGVDVEDNYYDREYLLFRGHTTYKKETAIVRVEEDFKNIFNGELPTYNFKRYDLEEYLENN